MRIVRTSVCLVLLAGLLSSPLLGQSVLKALSGSASAQQGPRATDPLGRTTPRGTLTGFMQAAQKGDVGGAAEYLQLPRQETGVDSARMVQDLKVLLDHAYLGRLAAITDNPELTYDPQLDASQERVGDFTIDGKNLPLIVVRVPDGNSGHLWLISWTTLSKTADLANDVRSHELETRLPRILVRHSILSIAIWVWLAFVLLIPVAILVGMAAVAVARAPVWLLTRFNHRAAQSEVWTNIRGPVLVFATSAAHAIGMLGLLTVPLLFREYYIKVQGTTLLFAVAWLLWDFITLWTGRTRNRLTSPEERGTLSLTLLLHRMLKVGIVTAAMVCILSLAGVNLSAVLATLGIGGIAIALAAQKTIENLFGGLSILTDRVMRVGDICRVGDAVGTVEDIGLRSTRIRTYDRGLISVPNGSLASANVENLSSRDKMRVSCKISLRYETSRAQLEDVLAQLNAMLQSYPKVERSSAWVRLSRLAESALELEMQAYVLTREFNEFTAVREALLMRVMDIVESCGSALAFPSQTIYLEHEAEPAESGH
jgi:MscS family membrane protein